MQSPRAERARADSARTVGSRVSGIRDVIVLGIVLSQIQGQAVASPRSMPTLKTILVVTLGCLIACNGEEEEDPKDQARSILDACGLPTPCGLVHLPDGSPFVHLPLETNACIHSTLASAAPAHLFGTVAPSVRWAGDTWRWDLYVGAAGVGVLTVGDPDNVSNVSLIYHCSPKPVEEFECTSCGMQNCSDPSEFVCDSPTASWCSERVYEIEPYCP